MDAAKIYRETLSNLALAINAHPLPNNRPPSLKGFCEVHGLNRPNLCHLLAGHAKREMSVGLYLRVVSALGLCSPAANTPDASGMSLRQYLKIDSTIVTRTILNLYSDQ